MTGPERFGRTGWQTLAALRSEGDDVAGANVRAVVPDQVVRDAAAEVAARIEADEYAIRGDERRMVAEEIAQAIEAMRGTKKPYHYNAALTRAAGLARRLAARQAS